MRNLPMRIKSLRIKRNLIRLGKTILVLIALICLFGCSLNEKNNYQCLDLNDNGFSNLTTENIRTIKSNHEFFGCP